MKPLSLSLKCQHLGHSDLHEQIKCLMSIKVPNASIDTTTLSISNTNYTIMETIHTGEYGKLTVVQKQEINNKDETLYWKYSPTSKRSLFKEAVFQTLAHAALSAHGITWAVPEVESIFNHPDHGIGFLMSHPNNADIFANYLQKHFCWTKSCVQNDKIIIEVIAQLSIYLCILEDTLKMNHRDLKSTNVVLIQKSATPFNLGYIRKGRKFIINTDLRAIIIDFGFSCISYEDTIIAAGNYLPSFDGCPKEGRDLFLFLAHLWNVELLRKCITPKLQEWFKKHLQSKKMSWTDHLIKIKDTSLKLVYLYTTSADFSMPSCNPYTVLESLSHDFPSMITTR